MFSLWDFSSGMSGAAEEVASAFQHPEERLYIADVCVGPLVCS
jgi:hypothetical protein